MPRRSKGKSMPGRFSVGFLNDLDGRTDLAKALRTNRNRIVDDLGGEENLSHMQNTLVERFVWLEGIVQSLEHEMATGKSKPTEVVTRWVQAVNALSSLARNLGIERRSEVKSAWSQIDDGQPAKVQNAKKTLNGS